MEDVLTEGEVAKLLGVSRRTIQRWRLDGTGPVKPIPGLGKKTIRYSRAAVVEYIDKGAA